MPFSDRASAGRQLAQRLSFLRDEDVVVLGLPRGGVPVASEIAAALGAPLDVIVVRKLGVPQQPELAMGAIGEDGVRVLNPEVMSSARVTSEDLAEVEAAERKELIRRTERFRGGLPRVSLDGRIALIVDDGIATGATARAACAIVRALEARRVILAAPVGPAGIADVLADVADEVVCVETPAFFHAIGQWYDDFTQTSEAEVTRLLGELRS